MLKSLIVTAVRVPISTALAGPVAFPGIVTATLSRQLIGLFHPAKMAPGSVLPGDLFLISGQSLVKRLFHFSTTVSVIIHFIGGL